MNQCDQTVSGSDIYHKLGALEGKVDALIAKTTEYKNDLQVAFDRIRQLENRTSWILGGAVVISSLMPLVFHVITSTFQFKGDAHQEHQKVEYIKNI
jgi:dihydrofolate reductase